jgi:hypothetical protein
MIKSIFALIITLSAFANNSHFCKVKKEDTLHYKDHNSHYIYKGINIYRFEDEITRLIPTKYPVVDLFEHKNRLFLLTENYIFVKGVNPFRTQKWFEVSKDGQKGRVFDFLNDQLVIATDSQNIIILKIENGERRNLNLASNVLALGTHDNILYTVHNDENGRNMLSAYDSELKLLKRKVLERNHGNLEYKIQFDKKNLVLVNAETLHFYDLNTFTQEKSFKGFEGMNLISRPAMYNGEVSGCFKLGNKYIFRKLKY